MSVPLPKRVRRTIRSVLLTGLVRLIALIPLRPALLIAAAGGNLAYRLLSQTRFLALHHLALAFPEKTDAEREEIARRMFVGLARNAMEITAIRSYADRLDQYIRERDP
jgi:KDO2-lipid IV(A) lauroyltransferase